MQKKKGFCRPTYPIFFRTVTVNKQFLFLGLKALLKTQMLLEENQSSVEGTYVRFLKTWETIYGIIY